MGSGGGAERARSGQLTSSVEADFSLSRTLRASCFHKLDIAWFIMNSTRRQSVGTPAEISGGRIDRKLQRSSMNVDLDAILNEAVAHSSVFGSCASAVPMPQSPAPAAAVPPAAAGQNGHHWNPQNRQAGSCRRSRENSMPKLCVIDSTTGAVVKAPPPIGHSPSQATYVRHHSSRHTSIEADRAKEKLQHDVWEAQGAVSQGSSSRVIQPSIKAFVGTQLVERQAAPTGVHNVLPHGNKFLPEENTSPQYSPQGGSPEQSNFRMAGQVRIATVKNYELHPVAVGSKPSRTDYSAGFAADDVTAVMRQQELEDYYDEISKEARTSMHKNDIKEAFEVITMQDWDLPSRDPDGEFQIGQSYQIPHPAAAPRCCRRSIESGAPRTGRISTDGNVVSGSSNRRSIELGLLRTGRPSTDGALGGKSSNRRSGDLPMMRTGRASADGGNGGGGMRSRHSIDQPNSFRKSSDTCGRRSCDGPEGVSEAAREIRRRMSATVESEIPACISDLLVSHVIVKSSSQTFSVPFTSGVGLTGLVVLLGILALFVVEILGG
eukprot:gene7974-1191_t